MDVCALLGVQKQRVSNYGRRYQDVRVGGGYDLCAVAAHVLRIDTPTT